MREAKSRDEVGERGGAAFFSRANLKPILLAFFVALVFRELKQLPDVASVAVVGVYRAKFSPPFSVRTSLADAKTSERNLIDLPLFALGPNFLRLSKGHK